MIDVLEERRVVARKAHICGVCHGLISAGDTYQRQKCADSGELWTWKEHLLCRAIGNTMHDSYSMDEYDDFDPQEVQERGIWFFTNMGNTIQMR